jgi:nitroreductase
MNVEEAIRMKRAVREFDGRPLPASTAKAILLAGRRAQSAKNTQPWRFLAVQEPEQLAALSQTGTYAGHIAGAAMAVVILTPDPGLRWSILFDAGQACAYMQLAAWELGVGSCLATIYEPEAARRILRFPEDLHAQVAVSFGYPKDPSVMTAVPRRGGRRPSSELIFFEQWPAGQT